MNENGKPSWRIIPKQIYQGIAIFLLLACVMLTVDIIWQQKRPFTSLLNWLGEDQWWLAAFLSFLILFVGWVLVMLSLRCFSQMPTYQEELQAAGARDFKQLYQKQQEEMFLITTEPLTSAQQAKRSCALAVGGLFLSFITGTATAIIYLISNTIWSMGLLLALTGLIMGSWHGLKSLWLSRQP